MSDDSGILSEHQAPPQQRATNTSGGDYIPTSDEKKDIAHVDKLFKKAKSYRNQYDEKWLDRYKMFRGKQWKEQRPSYRHSEVVNLIFQTIQSQVPIVTDSRPKFEFLPQEPADYELSEILNEVGQADWITKNWQNVLTEVVYDGHIYGTGLSGLEFDPDKNTLCYKSTEPFYLFPDPDAKDVNVEAEFIIHAEPMDIAKIKRRWPEKGKYVKADLIDLMHGSKTDIGPMRFKSPTDRGTMLEGSSSADIAEKNKALVVTLYCKSEEYEDDQNDPTRDPSLPPPEPRLKYPNGKKIVVSNGVRLEVGPNPYDDGEFPYQRWPNYIAPREFWGISEIEQLEGPQKTFNKLVSFTLDVLTLMGNPIWVVDNTADIDTDNLFNRPGLVVEKAPGSEVRREEGVQLQPYVLQLIDRMKEWFDQVAGSNDITRGINPGGVTAASAIADLQNAAQTRIRQKSRNLDCYLQNLGQQYVSRVFQFYTAPQVFRLTGRDGAQKYFKFHVDRTEERVGQDGQVIPSQTKAFVENFTPDGLSQGIQEYQARGKFDVRVTTGSSLPFNKAQKEQQLYGLFDRQIIDAEEVLKGLEYPNYEGVMLRQQQKAEAAAQAQAMQAQGGTAPPQTAA